MGQVETQAPHSMQASGSTTADAPSSIEIADTGHIPTHASHAIHLSLSTTAFDIRPNSSEIHNSYTKATNKYSILKVQTYQVPELRKAL